MWDDSVPHPRSQPGGHGRGPGCVTSEPRPSGEQEQSSSPVCTATPKKLLEPRLKPQQDQPCVPTGPGGDSVLGQLVTLEEHRAGRQDAPRTAVAARHSKYRNARGGDPRDRPRKGSPPQGTVSWSRKRERWDTTGQCQQGQVHAPVGCAIPPTGPHTPLSDGVTVVSAPVFSRRRVLGQRAAGTLGTGAGRACLRFSRRRCTRLSRCHRGTGPQERRLGGGGSASLGLSAR